MLLRWVTGLGASPMYRVVICTLSTAVLCLSAGSAGARTDITKQRFAADGWSLVMYSDSFARQTHCRLRSADKRILYQPNALGFAFSRSRNTLGAWYRIDDHASVRWQDRYPTLVSSGAVIENGGLDNPTGGIVWIPIEEVAGANSVWVRPGGNGKEHNFRLTGFSRMRDAARRLGCVSDASFES